MYLNPEKKQHNVILLQKATISLKNAVIGCSTTMKIRIFHTAHYETRITENESYQTLVAIFDLKVVLFTARAVLAGSESEPCR